MRKTFRTGKSDGMEKLTASQTGGEKQLKNSPRYTKRREGRKESRQNGGWGVAYPQFRTFCLLVVYNIFFKFSIVPNPGVGVKSNVCHIMMRYMILYVQVELLIILAYTDIPVSM